MYKLKLSVRAMFSQRKDDDCCRRAILDIQTSGSGLFRSDRDLRRVRWGAEPDPLPESGRPHRNDAGGLSTLDKRSTSLFWRSLVDSHHAHAATDSRCLSVLITSTRPTVWPGSSGPRSLLLYRVIAPRDRDQRLSNWRTGARELFSG
jgi:hypothetical protein